MTVYTPRSITEWPHLRRDNQAREEIAKLEARVRELEEALWFYADPFHWTDWPATDARVSTALTDEGRNARVALGAVWRAPWRRD